MSIKSDPENEGWKDPGTAVAEPKVDKRTRAYRQAREAEKVADRNALAKESEGQARAALEQASEEQVKQIQGAVGNMNERQLSRRNEIADNLDALDERKMLEIDGDKILEPEDTERKAREAEDAAEAERQRLEAEANERAATEEQTAGVVHAEPKKYKLKVNGKEIELTEDEVLERAQKVASADEYLQAAARSVEQAKALAPSQDGSARVEQVDLEGVLTSALQGDKEAIKTIAQRLKAPSAVTPDVLSAVDDRMAFRSAADWFRGEYKDLTSDPMLYRLAVDEDSRLARQEPTLTYRERLAKAGDSVRAWKQGLVKSTPPPNPKLAAKAQVAPVPQASARQVTKTDEDEDEPVESVIDQMARSRHQQGAIRKQ